MVLHPRRPGDPFVAKWVMERIKFAREIGDQGQADELEALFDETTLRQIIETDRWDLVFDVFTSLETSLFIPVQGYMLDNWQFWKGARARLFAVRIAELAPQDFHRILTRFVEFPDILLDKEKLSGALRAVARMGKDAADIAKALVAKVEGRGDDGAWWHLLVEMVQATTGSDTSKAVALLARGFEEAEGEDEKRSLEAALSAAYEVLSPALPYFQHAGGRLERSGQGFHDLPELFESGAPLKPMDKAARAKGRDRLAAALELLPGESGSSKAAGFARALAGTAPNLHDNRDCEMLASFLLAATAAHHARRSFTFEGYEMSSLIGIASYDIADLPCYQAVVDALRRFHIQELAPAMVKALRKACNHYGGVHMTRMMGDLRHAGFVDRLIDCISKSSRDFIAESAHVALAKIGIEARETIIGRWSDFDSSQRIYGYGVLERIGGDERTVQFLAERFPEVRSQPGDLELWCLAAEAVPDRRFLDLLEGQLHRKLSAVDETYSTLCAVLDIERPLLNEARKRARQRKDKVSSKPLDELTVEDVMDKPPNMELRCESCGETNQFEMPGIYISLKHPKDHFCIGGDISCPSCGSLGPFEPGKMGLMAVTAELVKYSMAVGQGVKYRGPIHFLIASLHNGRLVSPRTAVQEYRRRVERDPDSVPDLLGLGNIYVHIGSRKLAAVCFGKCLALEPACAEAAFSLAKIRLDGGDPGGAFRLLHDTWRLHDQWRFHRLKESSPEDFTWSFVGLCTTIARKLGKPKLSMTERASVGAGKPGRNASCLCGSGKKYKKCCGAV